MITVSGAILWLLIWGFAAGWAGEIRFFLDTDLGIGEWLPFAVFYYAAPALTIWGAFKLIFGAPREGRK